MCCKTEKFEICEKIYKNKNMLAFHRLTYGTTELYRCQYCERFVFSSSLGLHLISDHRDKFQSLCSSCIKIFLSKLELIIHRKNHPKAIHEQKQYLCYFCCDVLDSFIKLQYHEKWIHEGRKEQQIPELKNSFKYICEMFGLIFKYCALLKNHASVHRRTKNSLNVKSVEWCERAGGCCSNIRFPIASIKNVVAQSVTQYPRLPSTLPNRARNSHGTENCSFLFLM